MANASIYFRCPTCDEACAARVTAHRGYGAEPDEVLEYDSIEFPCDCSGGREKAFVNGEIDFDEEPFWNEVEARINDEPLDFDMEEGY